MREMRPWKALLFTQNLTAQISDLNNSLLQGVMDRTQPIKCYLIRGYAVNNTAPHSCWKRQVSPKQPICLGPLSLFHGLFLLSSSSSLQGTANSLPQHWGLASGALEQRLKWQLQSAAAYGGCFSCASLRDLTVTRLSVYLLSVFIWFPMGRAEDRTEKWNLLGSVWLQVQAVLQPGEFGVWNTICMAVQTGSDTGFLGLSLRIDQDYWRH